MSNTVDFEDFFEDFDLFRIVTEDSVRRDILSLDTAWNHLANYNNDSFAGPEYIAWKTWSSEIIKYLDKKWTPFGLTKIESDIKDTWVPRYKQVLNHLKKSNEISAPNLEDKLSGLGIPLWVIIGVSGVTLIYLLFRLNPTRQFIKRLI